MPEFEEHEYEGNYFFKEVETEPEKETADKAAMIDNG